MITSDEVDQIRGLRGAGSRSEALVARVIKTIQSPLVWAVVASRLLVIAAGAAGALFTKPASGWQPLDPTRLSTSFGPVGNILMATVVRWDAIHYVGIASQGYKPAGDTGFFPFYPLLIRVVGWVLSSNVAAGLLISIASFCIALTLLHRIVSEELDTRIADATVLLLAYAPLTLFFTAIYTESLFFALSVGTFYLARKGRFGWACVTAACGTITHVEGLALWAPVAYMLWEANGRRRDVAQLRSWHAAALALPPATLLGLFYYMHANGFGWLASLFGAHPTGDGRSIAPKAFAIDTHSPDALVRTISGPIETFWHAFIAGVLGMVQTFNGVKVLIPGGGNMFSVQFQNVVYLAILFIVLATLVSAWRILPKAYAIYATVVVLVFTMSDVTVIPLRAFDRYMLPLFPLWMMAAKWLTERKLLKWVLALSPCLVVLYTLEFARWVMVG